MYNEINEEIAQVWKCHMMSVPFVSFHHVYSWIQAYFIKSCFERLWKIVPKFKKTFLKYICVPKFSKKIQAAKVSMQLKGLREEYFYA
jgi:hypothetical protein